MELFFTMKSKKQPALACPIDAIGASARPMVAFSGFCESHEPPPSGDVHGIVPPHRHGHRNGQQIGYMLYHHFVCCRPGGRRGNTKASDEALVMLHRAMRFVSHRRTAIAIKMARDRGAFVPRRRLFQLL
jgi:hypothetical protein